MKIEISKNTLKAYFRARREFLDARAECDDVKNRWFLARAATIGRKNKSAEEEFKDTERELIAARIKKNTKNAELERVRGNLLAAIKKYEKEFV